MAVFENEFDKTEPLGSRNASDIDNYIRLLEAALVERYKLEHYDIDTNGGASSTTSDTNAQGRHIAGKVGCIGRGTHATMDALVLPGEGAFWITTDAGSGSYAGNPSGTAYRYTSGAWVASQLATGTIYASAAEVEAGTVADKAISPATLATVRLASFEQQILTGTNTVFNHATEVVNPVEGVRGDDEAFWLVTDDNDDSAQISIVTSSANSVVQVAFQIMVDTNEGNVGVAAKLQRSLDSGSSWTDLALGDASSTRVRCTVFVGHGSGERSLSPLGYVYFDEPGVSGTVMYRIIYTAHPGFRIYLNRDFNIDSGGDSSGVSTAEYRCSSYMYARELWS